MRKLPNILSCCRIVFALCLLVTRDTKILFILLYMMCGITDFADGFLARKMCCVTSLGAKLDSYADMTFSLVTLYLIFSNINLKWSYYLLICVLFVGAVRLVNMLITKIKYKQWNVIHTIGNKATGLVLFLILPAHFIGGSVPAVVIAVCLALSFFSSLEETCILLLTKYYDVNRKSLLSFVDGKFLIHYTERVRNEK